MKYKSRLEKINKEEKVLNYVLIFIVIICFLIILPINISSTEKIEYDYTECVESNLERTVDCTLGHVNTFFKYKETDDSITLTDEQLFNEGGDCRDWSAYYKKVFEHYGYATQYSIMETDLLTEEDKIIAHKTLIVWDKNGTTYCVVDQRAYSCFDLSV